MTVVTKVLVPSKYMENVQTTQYTANNVKAVIDKSTITNIGVTNVTYSVNLVTSGGSASNANLIIDNQTISPGECLDLVEIMSHVLDSGGFISTIASISNALVLRISGREIT